MTVARPAPDWQTLQDAWGQTLDRLGLGRVRWIGGPWFGFDVLNGELRNYPVTVLPAGASAEEHLSTGMNQPFDDPDEPPFRVFVIPGAGQYQLGIIYQHWAADSVSVQMLLGELFATLHDPPRIRRNPVRLAESGYWLTFCARNGAWKTDQSVLALLRRYFRYRRVRKIDGQGLDDPRVRFASLPLASGAIADVRAYARSRDVKVHDVLAASLLEACAAHVPLQFREKRTDLAIGSIVDLRRHARCDLSDVFGLFLGFTGVICPLRDIGNWDRLLRSVAAQNHQHKREGIAQSSTSWMQTARIAGRYVAPDKLLHFYRKEMPMVAGLSNVDLSQSWAARYAPDVILDYVRVSPTGPLAPLAVAATTLGRQFRLGVTYRSSLIPEETARTIVRAMLDRLNSCAGSPHQTVALGSPVDAGGHREGR